VSSSLLIEPHNTVLLLRLAGPDDFPRLTRELLTALHRALSCAQGNPSVSAIVITGTEKCFAAGADIAEVGALTPAEANCFAAQGQSLMRTIVRSPKPVVAGIRGYCLGGGFDLALACHLRVASTDARFAHPGGSLGILTGWGGTQRLPRIVGRARALELLATGRTLAAEEALAWRLVNRLTRSEETENSAILHAARLRWVR
jgi:enoyl-CoA hydratase